MLATTVPQVAWAGGALGAEVQPDDRDASGSGGWTIVLGSVAGDEADAEAKGLADAALERVRTFGRLSEATLERRGRSWVLCYGRYDSPDDRRAERELERVRTIEVDGVKPYATAYVAPPPGEALKGSIPEYDLRNARRLFGKEKAAYTLQIGIYGNADGAAPSAEALKQARQTAEKAVQDLRRDGELAFYFHGPTRSTVTVGLFSASDVSAPKDDRGRATRDGEAPELIAARKLHPHNLLNGEGIKQKIQNAKAGDKDVYQLAQSFLVEVPKGEGDERVRVGR